MFTVNQEEGNSDEHVICFADLFFMVDKLKDF